ncbi:MAG: zinc-dependent metalloprotease [Bacteroidota bacterium]
MKLKLILVALTVVSATFVLANNEPFKKKKDPPPPTGKKVEDKYTDLIKKCKKKEGLFNFYTDTVTGKTYFEVRKEQLDQEVIYFNYIENAPAESGYHRGAYGDSKIVTFHKNYERIEIRQTNVNFYFDPNNAISKAAEANINHPVLASEKIEVVSKDGLSMLIDGDALFLSEKLQLVKFQGPRGADPVLGSLSKEKSKVISIKTYTENAEVVVDYVYETATPGAGGSAIEDGRFISVRYQHAFVSVPKNNFKPRYDDPRVGYFTTQVNDMTVASSTPWRDVIHRWDLQKKDANAKLSEPVKPITFWMENTTPKEFRPIIKDAVERWNEAFEYAGFKNAVVCFEQPDDATWDAGDIRYNVLRWTSTPAPPFGGYGPSFVNPRTGEILGADIMLEWVALTNRVYMDQAFKSANMLTDEQVEVLNRNGARNPFLCMAASMSNQQLVFGSAAANVLGASELEKEEIVKQMLYRLVLHEVGHTLGLTHNMRASTLHSVADIKNVEKVKKEGLANSVMEYPAFNYQINPKEQGLYCDVKVGPYDKWVIEYGYSPSLENEELEQKRLFEITKRSTEHQLAYGNDADDMRSSGRGIDPDVNIFDLSSDPVQYGAERCELVKTVLPGLKDKLVTNNESYADLLQAFNVVTGEYAVQTRVMTRQIGGVHFNRAFVGQGATEKPLEPVAEATQRAAMKALEKYAFAAEVWKEAVPVYAYLLEKRRGFSHFSENEDPNIHQRLLNMQKECLNQLLHPNVLTRILDSEVYGNTYSLDEVMTDLTNAIFQSDLKTDVNTARQNLQIEYVKRLSRCFDEKMAYDHASVSMMKAELKRIEKLEASNVAGNAMTKAHRAHVVQLIQQAFESN